MALGPVGEKIAAKLNAAFEPVTLEVIDESDQHHGHAGANPAGESHFRVRIVAEAFRDKSRVERHRVVHETLAEELTGRIHALALDASAPVCSFREIASEDVTFSDLLARAKLPRTCPGGHTRYFGIYDNGGKLLVAGGLEPCGTSALLCSIVVDPAFRGKKLGRGIVRKLLEKARQSGARDVYLLTETAADFFAAQGFEKISREHVPPPIAATSQFLGTACAVAQVMRMVLATPKSA